MLVGRAAELECIDRLVGDLADGRAGALWIAADPGAGATALLDVAARRAVRRGVAVARMRAEEPDSPARFALVVDLLRVLGTHGPTTPGNQTADALVDVLLARTAERPLLVLLDDLTEADDASRRAIGSAVARLRDQPLAVLAVGSPWSPSLRWPCLRLGPLDDEASRAVVRAVLGAGAPDLVVAGLVERLGGNPLALVEVARDLTADQVAGRVGLPDPLPVGARLRLAWDPVVDRWPAATLRALDHVAVVGPRRAGLLAAVLADDGLSPGDLEPAESDGLVRLDDTAGPSLVHPVLGHVVLSRATPSYRRELHRRVARVAASVEADPDVVVEHLLASVALPDARTADELDRQADRALDREWLGLAARARAAAARTTPDPDVRTTRALAAVRQWVESGLDPTGSGPLLDLVAAAPIPAADASWVGWLTASAQPDIATGMARTRVVVAEARHSAPHLVGGLLWEVAAGAWAVGDPDTAMEAVTEFLGMAEAYSSPYLPWTGQALLAAALLQLGRVAEGAAVRREVLARSDGLDPTTHDLLLVLDAVFLDDLLQADGRSADTRLEAALSRTSAPDRGAPPSLSGIRAWRARARGDWAAAARMRDEGLGVRGGQQTRGATCGLLALSVELASLQGDRDRLRADGEALRRLGLDISDRRRLLFLERALGMDAFGRGDLETAAAHLGEAADVRFLGRGLRDPVLPSRVDLVEVLVRANDLGSARARRDVLAPLLLAFDEPLATAWAARVSAVVSDAADADAWFARALTAHGAARDPFEAGRTELLLGEHLRRTRRRADARAHLARAEALFAHVGAAPWRERARQELRVAGGHDGPPAVLVALTPQELNVARAAAQGHSTRQIAESLVLSPRTVETHLSSVYRKLGLRGRGGLASALAASAPEDTSASAET